MFIFGLGGCCYLFVQVRGSNIVLYKCFRIPTKLVGMVSFQGMGYVRAHALCVHSGHWILIGDLYIYGAKDRRSSLDFFVKIIFIVTLSDYYAM
jgi:hypothetical protein